MTKGSLKISQLFGSRLARNVYFWIVAIVVSFMVNFPAGGGTYHYSPWWYYLLRAITTLVFIAFLYFNNLFLVPRFLAKKKTGKYLLLAFIASYVTGLIFASLFKITDHYFPKIRISDVSIFSTLRYVVPHPPFWVLFMDALLWIVTLALILFQFTMAWYMTDHAKQQKAIEAAKKKQVEAELNFLKSQINPHFLFNTLNNLYALAIKHSDKTPDTILKLSAILRYLLYESNVENISFEKEKEIMQAYIALELLRLSNSNNFTFSISSDNKCNIPPLLWVPVLENVFKHGTRIISDNNFVDYRFTITNNNLTIYSKNNYKAINGNGHRNGEDRSVKGGIGLTNLQQRLNILYPDKHHIYTTISDNYYITEVQIELS